MKWYDIAPRDALSIDCTKRPDLDPPLNEAGEPCPWPWDAQLRVGVPMGQFHCPHCGAMCVAGVRHPDYSIEPDPKDLGEGPIEDWPPRTPPGGIEVSRTEG